MRARDIKPIMQCLVSKYKTLRYNKKLLYLHPLDFYIRGVHFDHSDWDTRAFYFECFVMPLCVPTDYMAYSFGMRVGHAWSLDQPDVVDRLCAAIDETAMPFITSLEAPADFFDFAEPYMLCPHTWQARAYCLARAGERMRAIDVMDAYLPDLDVSSFWQKEIAEETIFFRNLLATDPAAAERQLIEWERFTLEKLHLLACR